MGLQTDLSTQYGFPDLQATMQRFADLGLDVAETEVDVRTAVEPGATEGAFTSEPLSALHACAQQAYRDQTTKACLVVQRCVSYTVWGVADSNSWIRASSRVRGLPCSSTTTTRPSRSAP